MTGHLENIGGTGQRKKKNALFDPLDPEAHIKTW